MELGNALFGNSRGAHEVDRSLQDFFYQFLASLGFKGEDLFVPPPGWQSLPYNGSTNGTFIVRPYYWGECDCGNIDEEGECKTTCPTVLPNFVHIPSGFELQWYKYPLRDSYSNRLLTAEMIRGWMIEATK